MWISKMMLNLNKNAVAESGVVTISDDEIETGSTVTERNISCVAPFGYEASIPTGEEVVIIPSSEGQVALGAKSSLKNSELQNGEIKISSAGGAKIEFKNDGSVVINSLKISADGEIIKE